MIKVLTAMGLMKKQIGWSKLVMRLEERRMCQKWNWNEMLFSCQHDNPY